MSKRTDEAATCNRSTKKVSAVSRIIDLSGFCAVRAARFGLGAKTAVAGVRRARETGERQARLREKGVATGLTALWRFFEARGRPTEKVAHACEQARPNVREAREAWFEAQPPYYTVSG